MRAIVVMFDSLNRRLLPPYGDVLTHAPNFTRLAERTATFDNSYAGSMPCMPARRELHTGRYNFLHRSWGPIEPFDDSAPEILSRNGVYTHMVTDHQHYWEDGGATYHNRYSSYEFFRGQEGDLWKGVVDKNDSSRLKDILYRMQTQDGINRTYLSDEADHPQTLTFNAGLEFIETNAAADNWMLQLETFDPHEPFFSYDQYHRLYPDSPLDNGDDFDWPPYARVTESGSTIEHAKRRYLALLSMCDANLGRVLDLMDEKNMWDDTMLIVCTDHGYMLGERGWWGKSVMPWYDETIHTPFFVWDPRSRVAGERRQSLVQTIDIAPTLLDFFGLQPTPDMLGRPLKDTVANDTPVREGGLFGIFGGHVSVTDGRYVYMRASAEPANTPLLEHTLMPTHMRTRFEPSEFKDVEMHPGFSFTKGAPVMRMTGWTMRGPAEFGTLLYDLETDPGQTTPLRDAALELRMADMLVRLMRENDAPPSQYERLGLPTTGPVTEEHLLIDKQWAQVEAGQRHAPNVDEFSPNALIATLNVNSLLANSDTKAVLVNALPSLSSGTIPPIFRDKTLLEIAGMVPHLDKARLDSLEHALQGAVAAE
ncbi:MAG: sulfatase-like hydrolase/transferase [Devosia sp.]|jgi:arylsulfatase A-like enzyme|uniref:sulfatase-like hydrolase/transferase n=1 Tax=Devosia sp. TaxID=1871048 RepID=UPI001A0595BA|nr:sulfatase-like hydrolase/transferase [Devosia sp.]MBF0678607.1 sulfatase-like hydrolase/transferase [Devosia sp.]